MKPLMHLLLPIIGLLFMFNCNKDDDSAPAQNQEPDSFTVAVTQVTGSTAQSIRQTADGGYIVAGISTSSDGDVGNNNGSFDYWIVKLDVAGSLVWETNLGAQVTIMQDLSSKPQTEDIL